MSASAIAARMPGSSSGTASVWRAASAATRTDACGSDCNRARMAPACDFTPNFAAASIQAIFTAGVAAGSVIRLASSVTAACAAEASRCGSGAIQDPSTRSMFDGAAQTPRVEIASTRSGSGSPARRA